MSQFSINYFSDLSPSLMSLSFYTCFADAILGTYDLLNKFTSTPTIHRKKHFFFADGHEAKPMMGFGDFLIRIDNYLVDSVKGNLLAQSLQKPENLFDQKICSIQLENLQVKKGSLSLVLNEKFIGNINAHETENLFPFPCDFIQPKNKLLLQNHSLVEDMEANGFEMKIKIEGVQTQMLSIKHQPMKAGPYTNSLIQFKKVGDE